MELSMAFLPQIFGKQVTQQMNYHREDYNVGFYFFYRLSISLSVLEKFLIYTGWFFKLLLMVTTSSRNLG